MGDWKFSIDECIEETDDKFVFVFDPTKLDDYNELVPYLKPIIAKGADAFMYVPIKSDYKVKDEIVPDKNGKQLISEIKDIIKSENRKGIILKHPTSKGGAYGRIETHVLVTDDPLARLNIIHSHMMKVKENLAYKRFKQFHDYIEFI